MPLPDDVPTPPADDGEHGLPDSWVDAKVRQVLAAGAGRALPATGMTRDSYLDQIEALVRAAAAWQAETGAIIDPVARQETGQTSPRFTAAGAVLLFFGRAGDLREAVYRGMDWSCTLLAGGKAPSPDFWMRELMTAWMLLQAQAPPERRAGWERDLRSIVPETIYWQVEKEGVTAADLHNWTVYAAAGEAMRYLARLWPDAPDAVWGAAFHAKYMPSQLQHFTNDGMYRDPNDPFTYDMTTRLQFATPFAFGFHSPLRPRLDELLRRGALMQLLYVSPEGFAPFGGRSNQIQMQEAILAALGELEAGRYRESDPALAGAFKRQARLSARSIRRWQEMSPHRHIKNAFPPEQMHGAEPYAGYAMYSMFAASCLGLAALFADESIAEAPTPAEIGGYVVNIAPAFHKIFAAVGGTQIEIDTRADLDYDATGLGRFHRAGVPLELGLSTPFTIAKKHRIPEDLQPPDPIAIGPAWLADGQTWASLASLSDGLEASLTVERESSELVMFHVTWRHEPTRTVVNESYRLTEGRLELNADVALAGQPAERVRMIVPLLVTDGHERSEISLTAKQAVVAYRGATLTVEFSDQAATSLEPPMANRNGIYRVLEVEASGARLGVVLRLG